MDSGSSCLWLTKGNECYCFVYGHARVAEIRGVFARFAADPELSFSFFDAANCDAKTREPAEECGCPVRLFCKEVFPVSIPQAVLDALNDFSGTIDASNAAKSADAAVDLRIAQDNADKASSSALVVQTDADKENSFAALVAQEKAWANPPAPEPVQRKA